MMWATALVSFLLVITDSNGCPLSQSRSRCLNIPKNDYFRQDQPLEAFWALTVVTGYSIFDPAWWLVTPATLIVDPATKPAPAIRAAPQPTLISYCFFQLSVHLLPADYLTFILTGISAASLKYWIFKLRQTSVTQPGIRIDVNFQSTKVALGRRPKFVILPPPAAKRRSTVIILDGSFACLRPRTDRRPQGT